MYTVTVTVLMYMIYMYTNNYRIFHLQVVPAGSSAVERPEPELDPSRVKRIGCTTCLGFIHQNFFSGV